eukprot:CAMPEP_0172451764 /NCGR_PEP_ID=MMETSP1065-20121228/9661_1 /TAXON_ID=265537 /ORGANISM="Amphiprora paludosa, Strain CCMP125" /LENGTH=1269 /DNA_ID=CAMNT_0013203735 /DNA_START=147 /DNA_END=3956 /DNA_ORIENTATION=-
MALAQKLEQDNLRLVCQRSVEELHQLFVSWFQGTEPREQLTASLMQCLAPDFSHVAPNGQFLQGRSILISHLQDKYGCYKNRLFQIEIYDVKLLWQDATGDKCLCTYEEWQSWLPDNAQELTNGSDNEDDSSHNPENAPEEVHQFGRLSTCLLERKQNVPSNGNGSAYRWIHVHETWLEAESPQHEPPGGGDARSYLEEETILTGPVEYHKMIANRSPPPNMLENGQEEGNYSDQAAQSNDEEDDDDDDSMAPPVAATAAMATAAAAMAAAPRDSSSSSSSSEDEDAERNETTNDDSDDSDDDDSQEPGTTDRHLLMLMSNQSLSREQMSAQDEARNILESQGIAFYELDGANPEERENRNSLFQLSGKWGQYPQFFLVDTAGSTTFWGDFDRFAKSHQAKTLQQDIEHQPDDTTEVDDDATDIEESSMPPLPPPTSASPPPAVTDLSSASSSSSREEDDEDEEESKPVTRQLAPVSAMAHASESQPMPESADNCKIVLLMSAQTLSRDQKQRQEDVARLLKENEVEFEQVDGSLKECREKRNQLFRVSSFWGKYPQLFHENTKDGKVTFWGTWDEFHTSVERGSVTRDLKYISLPPPASPEELSRSLAATASSPDSSNLQSSDSSQASEAPTESKALPTATAALASSAKQDAALQSSESSLHFDKPIILLLSTQSLSREQMNRQEQARQYLKGMEYTELDGASRDHRHARNELFKVSKLWGRYPQLHLKKSGQAEPIFFGDWEKMDTAHSEGTLKRDIIAIIGPLDGAEESEQESAAPTEESPIAVKSSPGVDKMNGAPSWATKSDAAAGLADAAAVSSKNRGVDSPVAQPPDGSSTAGEEAQPGVSPGGKVVVDLDPNTPAPSRTQEDQFMENAEGILEFEEESDDENGVAKAKEKMDARTDEEKLKEVQSAVSPIPQDASKKRHVSSKLLKYAKPLTWEKSLVGLSIHGFDIGTSQGPTADATWYKEVTDALEIVAQYNKTGSPQPRRKLALPETVFPTAHVALEGHGYWLSWDVLDAMEEWARAHAEIEVHSAAENRGVSVKRSSDGTKFWEEKSTATARPAGQPSSFHFDWTYSTPFPGKVEGGEWVELDESGMRVELLTDTSVPILFFDEITLFEDDLQNHGQCQFSVKLRVMPSCAYVLARLYVRVDQVTIRVRESRLLVDFFGLTPAVYRDVTWRECPWARLASNKLPTTAQEWHFDGKETPAWQSLLRKLPEVDPPEGVMKYATLEPSKALLVKQLNSSVAEALTMSAGVGDTSLDYLEV